MTEIDAATEQELLGSDLPYVTENLNEEELLGTAETPDIKDEHQDGATVDSIRQSQEDEIDLFDEAVAPSATSREDDQRSFQRRILAQPALSNSTTTGSILTASASSSVSSISGKYHCYIGNLTWWTTDADLFVNIVSLGVNINDILELKFFENRINGQSKGFVLAAFGSDSSLKTVMEQLPNRIIHQQKPTTLAYTKMSLAKLEEQAAKTQTRPDNPRKKEENVVNMGTIRIGAVPPPIARGAAPPAMGAPVMNRAPLPLMINGQPQSIQQPLMARPIAPPGVPAQMVPPGIPNAPPMMSIPPGAGAARPLMPTPMPAMPGPQPLMGSVPMRPGVQFGGAPQPLMGALRPGIGMPPPGAHVNPNVFPVPPINETEFEEIMNRNRTVSSSAISRAMSDAHAGDVKAAIETLQTAMNLIKASRVAHDDRCRVLINQLDDALRSIDTKGSYHSSSSRSSRSYRDRDRDRRSRSRSRDRKRRRRSRSRSGSRSRSRSPSHRRSRRDY